MQIERRPNPAMLKTMGRTYRAGMPSEPFALPFEIEGMLFLPDSVQPAVVAILPGVIDMLHRIVPWAPVHVGPTLLMEADADERREDWIIDGKAHLSLNGRSTYEFPNAIGLALARHPTHIAQTAAHEAWHSLEFNLPAHWIEIVDRAIEGDAFCPPDAYSSRRMERRARAFEAWAARIIEGLPGELVRSEIDEIFAMAWDGRLGLVALDRMEKEAA